jgi:hypothetical protein
VRATTVLAIGLVSIAIGLIAIALILGGPAPTDAVQEALSLFALLALVLSFPLIGALLAARVPRNPIGWLFIVTGLGLSAGVAAESYAAHALKAAPPLPGGIWAAWISQWSWVVWITAVPLTLLLFPDGGLPSRRWRPVAAAILTFAAFQAFADAFRPTRFDSEELAGFVNPLGLEWMSPIADVAAAFQPVLGLGFVAAAVSVIARVRRARGLERQQLKWFGYAAGIVAVAVAVLLMVGLVEWLVGRPLAAISDLAWFGFLTSFNALPIAAAVAILRYRLYDIDVLINRTLVYGALSAVLLLLYAGSVVALQVVLSTFTAGSQLAVAGSTLAVVALVQPLRRRIQEAVDRRFYRRRYDAQRTLEGFGLRLRDEIDIDALSAELVGVVRETVQPAHASLWLRGQAR